MLKIGQIVYVALNPSSLNNYEDNYVLKGHIVGINETIKTYEVSDELYKSHDVEYDIELDSSFDVITKFSEDIYLNKKEALEEALKQVDRFIDRREELLKKVYNTKQKIVKLLEEDKQ